MMSRLLTCLRCAIPAVLSVVVVSTAHSQTESSPDPGGDPLADHPVRLVVTDCPSFDIDGLSSILSIELEALSVETSKWLTRNHPEVHLRCSETMVNVQVLEPRSGRFTGQHLDSQGEMKDDMARFVALTIVELIASRATNEEQEERKPQIAPTHPAQPDEKFPKLRLGVLFALHGGKKPFSFSVGAGLDAELAVLEYLAVAIDFQFFTSQTKVSQGRIRTDSFSGAAFLLGRTSYGFGVINPGIGIRAGALTYRGYPGDSTVTEGGKSTLPFGGPCIALHNGFGLGRILRFVINAEVGYTLWRAEARVDDQVAVSHEEIWFLLGAGIGISPT